jgi:DNA-binding response OmpR family regulator
METHRRLLLIGSDPALHQALADGLGAAGFTVVAASGGPEGADIALLDADSVEPAETCRALRRAAPDLPILAIGTGDVAEADSCLRKPVRLSQVVATLEDLSRQARSRLAIGPWRFEAQARLLERADGTRIRLTDKETAILAYLAAAEGPVPRDRLLRAVWGYTAAISTHTLETHIYRLRRKIEPDPSRVRLLITDPDGYRLECGADPE